VFLCAVQVRIDDLHEQGVPAVEVLSESDGVEGGEEAGSPAEPVAGPFPESAAPVAGGPGFSVLLHVAILRGDECRSRRQRMVVSGTHWRVDPADHLRAASCLNGEIQHC